MLTCTILCVYRGARLHNLRVRVQSKTKKLQEKLRNLHGSYRTPWAWCAANPFAAQTSNLPTSTEHLSQPVSFTTLPLEPLDIESEAHLGYWHAQGAYLAPVSQATQDAQLQPGETRHINEPSGFRISQDTPIPDIIKFFTRDQGIKNLTTELNQRIDVSLRPVAYGGVADIYRAILADGTKVAVKCLRQTTQTDSKDVKRTSRELLAWSKLNHENIHKFLGVALFNEQLAMISPWMDCGNIIALMKRWPFMNRYRLNTQLASAVAYLHGEADVVHGDLKGDNVLYSEDGYIKLTDFGLAITTSQTWMLSQTDLGGGTLRWMAPELITEEGKRSKEADVYAMGMTMLEILTGKAPFEEIRNGVGIIKAVVERGQVPVRPDIILSRSRRGLMFWATLVRCWSYYPNERPNANEVVTLDVQMSLLGPD